MLTFWMIVGATLLIALMSNVITIPNRKLVKPTTTPRSLPGVAKTGFTNPAPVRVSKTGASPGGNPLLERCTGGREGYYGFNLRSDVPAGAAAEDEGMAPVRGVMVEGFAGVAPGEDVFIDPTAAPVPDGVFSGLTHVVPAGGRGERIGVGATTTKIMFD